MNKKEQRHFDNTMIDAERMIKAWRILTDYCASMSYYDDDTLMSIINVQSANVNPAIALSLAKNSYRIKNQ
jgi:hypothetical protein